MSIKTILCVFGGEVAELPALTTALRLARTSQAAVRILHVSVPPLDYSDGLGMAAYGMAGYGDGAAIDMLETANVEMTVAAHTYALASCKAEGVPLGQGTDMSARPASAVFRKADRTMVDCLPAEGRSVDLIVTSYDNHPDGDFTVVLAAVFRSGRPVLLIPERSEHVVSTTGYARSVIVAWDDSLSAARALRDALAHMKNAAEVTLVKIDDRNDEHVATTEADILSYLAAHGVHAQIVCVLREGRSVGAALLHHVDRLQADLLVMGAYGRGHLGEMIVGGATDHVLKHTTGPVLLVH